MTKRIGSKMKAAVEYVEKNPGCSKLEAGVAAGGTFGGNMRFVYGPVDRAIAAGLIVAERKGNRYALKVAP